MREAFIYNSGLNRDASVLLADYPEYFAIRFKKEAKKK
jgi:hypothetical protein